MADDPKQSILSKYRVEALSDGIFAFAMTLLVLNIGIPAALGAAMPTNNESARMVFVSLLPSIGYFIIAFVTIAAFWMSHHRIYDPVKRVDSTLLWMNTVCLMLVVLLPFSIELVDTFSSVPVAALIFESNILMVWTMVYLQVTYAQKNPHLLEKDAELPDPHKLKTLIMPILTLIAMGIAVLGYSGSTAIYLLLPIAYAIRR